MSIACRPCLRWPSIRSLAFAALLLAPCAARAQTVVWTYVGPGTPDIPDVLGPDVLLAVNPGQGADFSGTLSLSSGSVTVGSFYVGSYFNDPSFNGNNAGNLTITSGATLTAMESAIIGDFLSYGKVVVDGAGSRLTTALYLGIGDPGGGGGTLIVQNGGAVSTFGEAWVVGGIIPFVSYGLGPNQPVNSRVVITGAGSTWTTGAISLGQSVTAPNSASMIIVSDGGSLTTGALSNVRFGQSARGAVVLDGGSITVGALYWSGSFLGADFPLGTDYSGVDSVGPLFNFRRGTLTVTSSLNLATTNPLVLHGVSPSEPARLVLDNIGVTNLPLMPLENAHLKITGNTTLNTVGPLTFFQSSHVTIDGAGAKWTTGSVTFHLEDAAVDLLSGGKWESTAVNAYYALPINVTGAGSKWTVTGDMNIRPASTSPQSSPLNLSEGGALVVTGLFYVNKPQISIDGGSLTVGSLSNALPSAQIALTNPVGGGDALIIGTSDPHSFGGFSGTISGTGSVLKVGANLQILDGNNTYSGGTTINGGTLSIYSDAALGATSGVVTLSGGTLQAGSMTSSRPLILAAGGGTLENVDAGTVVWNGAITGAAGNNLTKTGPGTLVLGGTNTYSGDTLINFGTLKLGAANALSPNSNLVVAAGANFNANGFTPVIAAITGAGTIDVGASGLTVATSGSGTFGGTLGGAGGFTMSGSGTLTLGAANTYSGATAISNGTVTLGAPGALPGGSPLSLSSGGRLDLNGNAATLGSLTGASGTTVALTGATLSVAQSGNTTFAGVLSGNGGLTKSGAGMLTLTGTNTFSGATSITGGAIRLNGSAANSAFTLSGGGTLSGNGTVGPLTIGSGGILSPGNSPGTTSAGNTTWNGGGAFTWELNKTAGTAGSDPGWDLLSISGTLAINANPSNKFTINLTSLTPGNVAGNVIDFSSGTNYSYTFVATTGGITGFAPDAFTLNTSGFSNPFNGTWSIGQSGDNLTLNYAASAIPEPSTYAALLGALALGLSVCRKHRRVTQSPTPRG